MSMRWLLVCTRRAEIFVGAVLSRDDLRHLPIVLYDGREVTYAGTSVAELAVSGPGSSTIFSSVAPTIVVHDVACVIECAAAGRDAWAQLEHPE